MTQDNVKRLNSDWVKVRGECSIAAMFAKLKLEIKQDIENLKAISPTVTFKLVESGNSFIVVRAIRYQNVEINFDLADSKIHVSRQGHTYLTATVTLDDDGECRFLTSEKALESWQFRRMALENLFFELID